MKACSEKQCQQPTAKHLQNHYKVWLFYRRLRFRNPGTQRTGGFQKACSWGEVSTGGLRCDKQSLAAWHSSSNKS